MSQKPRIGIIGFGPSGAGVINAFKESNDLENFDIVCFEKNKKFGGIWNFDYQTGIGRNGETVHSSMYKHLWSNAPKEYMEYPDFTFKQAFGRALPSYPPRSVMYEYFCRRFEQPEILNRVRFDTVVRDVVFDQNSQKFTVVSCNLSENSDKVETFDYVFVCTGHYACPNMIEKPGFESFPGKIVHSHDFRDAEHFKGQTILTIGSSYSAEDVASQCVKYGAKKAYLSARTEDMTSPWHRYQWPKQQFEKRSIVTKVEGSKVFFKNGEEPVEVDTIFICTGFKHYYPFLRQELRLDSGDVLYPKGLYKGTFWQTNPKLMYIGAQHQWFTNVQFEIQGFYARDVITGKIKLPSAADRQADIDLWLKKYAELPDKIAGIQYQGDMIMDLLDGTNYHNDPKTGQSTFNVQVNVKNYEDYVENKCLPDGGILKFRDLGHIDPITLEQSPKLNGTWMTFMHDDFDGYMEHCL